MTAPATCLVTTTVYLASGQPDLKARIIFKLASTEMEAGVGFVLPSVIEATADPVTGLISATLARNVDGLYNVTIEGSEKTERTTCVVPDVSAIALEACAAAPEDAPRSEGQVSVDAAVLAGVMATEQANIATEQAGIATTKAGEASASAGTAAGSATTATNKASEAQGYAVSASNSKDAAADSEASALDAAGTAGAAATAAVAAKNTATTKAGEAADSATTAGNAAGTATGAANTATTKAGEAANSATAAGNSATAAIAARDAAQGYRDTAKGHADNAATSAGQAAAAVAQVPATVTAALAPAVAAAAASAQEATAQAGNAASSSSSALAAFGGLVSLSAALLIGQGYATSAQAQANAAAASAQSAASVAQQDLSGLNAAALHRSPNAVTALYVYDTAKDSDGGAWTERVQHTSWMQELLNGTWLDSSKAPVPYAGFQNELEARLVGAALGVELIPNTALADATGYVGGSNVTLSAANGQLTVTNTGTGTVAAQAWIEIDTVVGQLYYFSAKLVSSNIGTLVSANIRGTNNVTATIATSYALGASSGLTAVPFVATTTKSRVLVRLDATGAAAGQSVVWSNLSCKPVTAFNTTSGSYYPNATDGKFYRLWKNLIGWSEQWDNIAWSKSDVTVAPDAIAGPFGGTTADKIAETATAAFHESQISIVATAGVSYCGSVYVKAAERGFAFVGLNGAGGLVNFASVNLATGAVSVATSNLGPVAVGAQDAGNGWWRVYVSGTAQTSTSLGFSIRCSIDGVWANRSYLGTAGSGVYVWGAQFEIGTAPSAYEAKSGLSTQTEVFRGNTAKFPKQAAIVAEANRIVVYDLTQPGRPMWMVFTTSASNMVIVSGSLTSVFALNGRIITGANGSGFGQIDFIQDRGWRHITTGQEVYLGNITQRNAGLGKLLTTSAQPLGGTAVVNAVAMTVLPNAPVDPVTNLPVPTIAVAVGTGFAGQIGTVLMNDGTAVNYSQASQDGANVAFTKRGEVVWSFTGQTLVYAMPLATANVAQVSSATSRSYGAATIPSTGTGASKKLVQGGNVLVTTMNSVLNGVSMLREHPSTPGSGLAAQITGTYNTGWMVGDIRRCLLADTAAGAVVGGEVVTNGTFDSGITNWIDASTPPATFTWDSTNKCALLTRTDANNARMQQGVPTVPGMTYLFTVTVLSSSCTVSVGSTQGGVDLLPFTGATSSTQSFQFRATGTTSWLSIITSGVGTVQVDNVSVKAVVADRSVKAKPASINGTLALTAVAAGAQMVCASGFTNDAAQTVELVTNGTFDTDASGWTPASSTLSVAAGQLTITNSGAAFGNASQPVATVVGRKYTLVGTRVSSAGGASASDYHVGTSAGGVQIAANGQFGLGGFTFTATSATTYITLLVGGNTAGASKVFDNISVKAADAIGSAANVIQETANSTDLGYGTGAWTESAPFNTTGFGPANFCTNFNANPADTTNVGKTGDAAATLTVVDDAAALAAAGLSSICTTGKVYKLDNTAGTTEAFANFGGTFAAGTTNMVMSVYSRGSGTSRAGLVANANTGQLALTANYTRKETFTALTGSVTNAYVGAQPGTVVYFILNQMERGLAASSVKVVAGAAYNGIAPISDYSGPSGAYRRLGIDGNGMLAAEVYDTVTTRRVTSTIALNDGNWHKGRVTYDGAGTLALLVDGVQNAQTTGAALLTLTNANALWTIGNSYALNAAFPGSIALVKSGATVPFAEQSAWAYAQERAMFQPGAQVTLADTGAVLAIDYDRLEDKVKVLTAANDASFIGLVRVNNTAVSAGAYTKVAMESGWKLVARSTTNPGVDVSVRSLSLREELNRKNEVANDPNLRNGRTFKVKATASQSRFPLQVGYEANHVFLAGLLAYEGASDQYTVEFNGFYETVVTNAGQALNTAVQIAARRAA